MTRAVLVEQGGILCGGWFCSFFLPTHKRGKEEWEFSREPVLPFHRQRSLSSLCRLVPLEVGWSEAAYVV